MPGANPEQLKAIEHHGGALLSAGAGSGKTFVLTEHLIYLAKEWIESWSPDKDEDFSRYIKSKFSKVVLMTFTKKAAGEIGIRITQKFEKAVVDNPDTALLWEKAVENLDSLTISTIHGYCYKLIKQGFFAEVNPNDEIIGEGEFAKQIEDIFAAWLEKKLEAPDSFLDLVFKEKRAVLEALKNIISDPTLRLMWKNMDTEAYDMGDADKIVEELLFHQDFNELFDWNGDLSPYSEFEDKPWFKYLEKVRDFVRKKEFCLRAVNEFALWLKDRNFRIPSKPSAKSVPDSAKDVYVHAKGLKDFLRDNHEDLFRFEEEGSEIVRKWYGNFKGLFDHVERAYAASPGFTFGDLEFIVNEQLENPSVKEMVKLEYNYIIVDEFQDTSHIQFNILGKIIDFDYHKVFCVGDIKQAIYGFRGGELSVFLEMEKKTPLNLNLLNNYRSDQDIIGFNNSLFKHLFKLGPGFEGKDHYAVPVAAQTVPLEERPKGRVFEIDADLSFLEGNIESLNGSDIEYLEALALSDEIKRTVESESQIAVLYRKLKPSKVLMQLLLDLDIGFTSQVKVPMLEDPILGIFHLLVKNEFDRGKLKDAYLKFALVSYFKLLGKEEEENVAELAQSFRSNMAYYGLYQSFLIFLSSSGLVISNYQQSLENIRLLIDMTEGDLPAVVRKMEDWSGLSYSMEFQYGKNPEKVVIMSAHASKGLEFSKVLLGGIYTNEGASSMKEMFGKQPYSFKWAKSLDEKKKFKSPHYMLETATRKRKEFSESKRLFYVACTRAESELGWARLRFGGLKRRKVKGSWIYGIDSFFEKSEDGAQLYARIEKHCSSANLKESFDPNFLKKIANQPPMFHYDNLGVEQKLNCSQSFLMPELSVTRLAQVSLCPRKFYLGNVLKMEQEGVDREVFEKDDAHPSDMKELDSKSFARPSSAQRGIEIHENLSKTIKSNFGDIGPEKHQKQTSWVVEKLRSFGDKVTFVSERPIKFELFQYMISGIPDLIVRDQEGDCAEVWDFKTGRLEKEAPENYWFQLFAYAYAGFTERGEKKLKPIKLVLCYVDEQKIVDRIVSVEDVENYLWSHCENLARPDRVSPSHCGSCDFNKICKGKSLSSCAPSFSC